MISLRLTDEEYETFRRLCLARGLRNISELIRTAVNQLIDEPTGVSLNAHPPTAEMNDRVTTLESRLADLASAVAQIETRFAAPHPQPALQFAQSNGR